MFCRNCGNQMDPNAAICVKCGVPTGTGTAFCQNCGAPTLPQADFCTNCGTALVKPIPPGTQKSKMAAGLLAIFLGVFGIHNFYLGFNQKAIIQLILGICTAGTVSGIWGIIEGVMIFTGSINADANGVTLGE